jgi:hypothetical protein
LVLPDANLKKQQGSFRKRIPWVSKVDTTALPGGPAKRIHFLGDFRLVSNIILFVAFIETSVDHPCWDGTLLFLGYGAAASLFVIVMPLIEDSCLSCLGVSSVHFRQSAVVEHLHNTLMFRHFGVWTSLIFALLGLTLLIKWLPCIFSFAIVLLAGGRMSIHGCCCILAIAYVLASLVHANGAQGAVVLLKGFVGTL